MAKTFGLSSIAALYMGNFSPFAIAFKIVNSSLKWSAVRGIICALGSIIFLAAGIKLFITEVKVEALTGGLDNNLIDKFWLSAEVVSELEIYMYVCAVLRKRSKNVAIDSLFRRTRNLVFLCKAAMGRI